MAGRNWEEIIKALHAKAKGSDNEAESSLFMKRVEELLIEHNLSDDIFNNVNEEAGDIGEDSIPCPVKLSWFGKLGVATSELYFTFVCYTVEYDYSSPVMTSAGISYKKRVLYTFVGKKHNRFVAISMFKYFMNSIDRLAKNYSNVPSEQYEFKKGACLRLVSRIYEEIRKRKSAPVVSSNPNNLPALIANENAAIALYNKKNHDNLKAGKKSSAGVKTDHALAGVHAANTISLNNQVSGHNAQALLGKVK